MMKQVLLFASVCLLTLASCKKDDVADKQKVFKGAVQQFQHGKSWTWYEADDNGNPARIAIAIDDAAMSSLDRGHGGSGGHQHHNSVSLKLHPKAGATPFTHALLDWNPHGHPPEQVYDKAHFDLHFYISTEAERLAIPPFEVAPAKFDVLPGAEYLPAGYFRGPGGVPQMGVHWLDSQAPELNGGTFGETFLFGSYDGKVTFYEPMITEAFVKNNTQYTRNIPQPAKVQQSGWYPTKMRLVKKDGATHFILENFIQRQAS